MATAITTVTKTASIVKTTKGSEKKWSEILTMNRRHDLQLPLDIAKYNSEFQRTYKSHQRQQNQTERSWAHKHATWYHDDFIFRDHLLKQLKPITRRFKNIDSLSVQDPEPEERKENGIFNDERTATPAWKRTSTKELPPIKSTKNRSNIQQFHDFEKENARQSKTVLSKLVCPKVLNEYQPRLHSRHHAAFLDIAQRFLKHKPESIEKGPNNSEKQNRQKKYLKNHFENEQERARLAALKFGQSIKKDDSDDDYSEDDDEN